LFAYILSQKHHLKSSNVAVSKVICLHCTTGETKLYLLFFYYGMTMLFLIYGVVTFLRSVDALTMHSNNFILCSAGGYKKECEMHKERAEGTFTITFILGCLVGTLISILNLTHLLYVVNIPKVIEATQKYVITFCRKK